jgi:hypothetical protein
MDNPIFDNRLRWYPTLQLGYLPISMPKTDYFDIYKGYEGKDFTNQLQQLRIQLVDKYDNEDILDFGVGAGTFIDTRGKDRTKGFDIDPKAVQWLQRKGIYVNPYDKKMDGLNSITFWDSLEHLRAPEHLLRRIKQFAFISIPIFRDLDDILSSKHFKPKEHFWYFTAEGLENYMKHNDFILVEANEMETELGRESIGTFVFRRR